MIVLRGEVMPSVVLLFEMPPPLLGGAELSAIVTLVRRRVAPFSIPPPLPAPITRLPLIVTLVNVISPCACSAQLCRPGTGARPQPLVMPPPPQMFVLPLLSTVLPLIVTFFSSTTPWLWMPAPWPWL